MSRVPRSPLLLLSLVALSLWGGSLLADDIILKKGKMRGVVVKTEGGQVFINPYNSRNPRMTYGVETIAEAQLKRVDPDPTPQWRYLETLLETCPPGETSSAEAEAKMARLATELGLEAEARARAREALVLGADTESLSDYFSAAEAERVRAADPRSSSQLRADLDAYYAEEKGKERQALLSRIAHDHGFDRSFPYMERVRRSRKEAKGRQDDRLVRLRSKTEKGVYTLFVPEGYDPERSWPLVLGLHGGGPDGKDRQDVVGSGRSAMNFYARGAAKYGYIVVCPTAVQAPWHAKPNDSFVRTVLEEMQLRFNIDLNRVYLTGHSMGGFGSWHFGSEYPELFAVVAPMSGGAFRGLSPFEKSKTPVYLHHGADDAVVGCANSREAAEAMRRAEHDFIYTEIPDSGHGFPDDVNAEMWRMFHVRRLAVAPKRAAKGRFEIELTTVSSFDLPVGRDEETYFGKPGEDLSLDRKDLLERLRLGGALAVEAADRLIEAEDQKGLVPTLAKLVTSTKEPDDVRSEAARILGASGQEDANKHLLAALRKPEPDLVPAFCRALMALGDPKSVKTLARVFGPLATDFDDRLSGRAMAYSDWARSLGAHEALVRLCAALGPADAEEPILAACDLLLLQSYEVPKSDRAGLDPDRPLGACAAGFVAALQALESDKAKERLESLKKIHGRLPEVAKALEN